MSEKLSVAIYRDAATPDISIEAALVAIELVNTITQDSLEVPTSSKLIKVAPPDSASIRPDKIRWPQSSVEIRLVMTQRAIAVASESYPLGFARSNNYGGGVAFIRDAANGVSHTSTIVAHELGHLLRLRYGDHDDSHCAQRNCIMYESAQTEIVEKRIRKQGLAGWKERRGFTLPSYELVEQPIDSKFCDSCENQLARKAFFMVKHRQGDFVPTSFL